MSLTVPADRSVAHDSRRYERLAGGDTFWFGPRCNGRSGRDPPLGALGCRRGVLLTAAAWHGARAAGRVSPTRRERSGKTGAAGASRWCLLGVMMDAGPEAFRRRQPR